MFNSRSIAICTFCNIWYSQSFWNCSTFISFNAIFICPAYLFTLQECLKSSFLSLLRVNCRTIHTCLNLVYTSVYYYYMLIIFGLTKLSWKLAVTSKRTRDQNLVLTKVSLFVTGVWTISLHITIQKYHFKGLHIYS